VKGYSSPSVRFSGFRFLLSCGTLALLLIFPQLLSAQDNALISGGVHDPSGAAVVGAEVVVAGVGGNLTRTTTTNSEGAYVVSALPSGSYNVTITAKGFQKYSAEHVVLEVAQKARIDVTLTVGSVTEEVVVTGENVAQLDTQSSEIGGTVTGKQINKLVLNGRNFTQLVNTVPGVVDQTGSDEGQVGIAGNVAYSINGGRTEYNNWELDGGDNMDNGSNATLNVYPNLEAIAEFKVLTSNYGAQYGKSGSGTVEVETKSGTKDFHGSAFYYGRNDFFNANSWQNNGQDVPRPAYKKHDWGYTIGGPLYIPGLYPREKSKTFFFWSQEWRHDIVPGGTISQAVPSADERTGNFNDVCFNNPGPFFQANPTDANGNSLLPPGALYAPDCPASAAGTPYVAPDGTTIPTYIPFAGNQLSGPYYGSTTAAALNSLIPAANNFNGIAGQYTGGPSDGANLPAYVANPSYPTTWREELIRVDQNLTDNERLTFRYIHDSWNTIVQGPEWGVYNNSFDNTNTNFAGPTTSFVTRLTSNISPTLLNEFVASYTSDHILFSNASNVALPSGGIDLAPFFDNGFAGKIPAFSVGNTTTNIYGGGGFAVDTGYFPWKNANPTYTYRDIMTKILGNHTLFFGGYVVFAQKNQDSTADPQGQLTFANNNPNSTGNPFADLLVGQAAGYAQTSQQIYLYDRYKIFEPFFQDDWRITKKLTLNLGLRWSFFGRYQEKNANEFNFSPSVYSAAAAPQYFDFNDPNYSQLLQAGSGNFFNGFERCGGVTPGAPGIALATTGCMKNKYMNPGPRIGFAYDPFGDGKWAIRGGYGIFFEHMNGNEANAESLQGNPSPLVSNAAISNVFGYPNVGSSAQGPAVSPLGATSIPGQVEWPYMQQWNLGVQHELPAHIIASVAYVGSKGTHLSRQFDLNQLSPVPSSQNPYLASGAPITESDCDPSTFSFGATGLPTGGVLPSGAALTPQAATNLYIACGNATAGYYRPYQGYGSLTRIENSASSNYNSLQVTARRTFGSLTFTAGYTWSHSIDDSSDRYDSLFVNSLNPGLSRSSSNFDVRNALTLSYVWEIPIFKQPGLKHTLLGGWQFSGTTVASTGVPFTVTNGTEFGDNSGVANGVGIASFPDRVGNPNSVPADVQQAFAAQGTFGKLLYNPTAYTLPVGLTFGDGARNTLRLPGRFNSNIGLFKTFPFKERYMFEFRVETFNTFNHTQLNSFDGSISSGGAGLTSSMGCNPGASLASGNDPTCGGFLVLNGAHDPRIMQFGLRFQF
jgi:hypothetical protein